MKKTDLYALAFSLIGSPLLALCFTNNLAALLCFIASVPMLISMKKSSSFLTSILVTIPAIALTIFVLNLVVPGLSLEGLVGQFLIFSLPWIFYQHIRLNHNEKLGYLTLVSSWVFLEWLASQYFGKWTGLQLGHCLTSVPFLINWYGFLGVSAGSVWILAINIHISRIILPAEAHTRKYAVINGILVVLVPVFASLLWPNTKKNVDLSASILEVNGKSILLHENDKSLSANELKIEQFVYNSVFDTVINATIRYKAVKKTKVLSKKLRVGSIGGIRDQHIVIADLDSNKIGLLNGSSMLRADLVRLYSLEKCTLLVCYTESDNIPPQIISSRALENQIDILLLQKDKSTLFLKSGKETKNVKELNTEGKKPGFFTLYGDLTGRLSIFVSLWMFLGSLVKPFRKK